MEIKNAADQDSGKIMGMRLRKSLAKGFPEVYINW